MPKLSILCPSFNHENYVESFIKSVLSQTEQDFELVIVDDCSSDKNWDIIMRFKDVRIKAIRHNFNQGINAALNTAFESSSSPYCSFIASDDILEPTYVETVCRCFEQDTNVGVFYCWRSFIDINNKVLDSSADEPPNSDKYVTLKRIFMHNNPLSSPGMAIRRGALQNIYPLNISLLQYQDVSMHVELLLSNELFFSTERLIKYRIPSNTSGISHISAASLCRMELETDTLMNFYIKIKKLEVLQLIFGDDIHKFGNPTLETIPYILARLALTSSDEARKKWGYRTIMRLISHKGNFSKLNKEYQLDFAEFISLANDFKNLNYEFVAENVKLKHKVKKYKKMAQIATLATISLLAMFLLRMGG